MTALNQELSHLEKKLEKVYATIGERVYNTDLRYQIEDAELVRLFLEIGDILQGIKQKEGEKEKIVKLLSKREAKK